MSSPSPAFGIAPSFVKTLSQVEEALQAGAGPIYVLRLNESFTTDDPESGWWAWTADVKAMASAIVGGATRVATFKDESDYHRQAYAGLDPWVERRS